MGEPKRSAVCVGSINADPSFIPLATSYWQHEVVRRVPLSESVNVWPFAMYLDCTPFTRQDVFFFDFTPHLNCSCGAACQYLCTLVGVGVSARVGWLE